MAKRRAAEMQTLEMRRPMKAAVSEPILLDLPIPAVVTEKIKEELIEMCVEHMEEIGPEASEMQTLEITKLVETAASEPLLLDLPNPAIFTEKSLEEHVEHVKEIRPIEDVPSDLANFKGDFNKKEKGQHVFSKPFPIYLGCPLCLFLFMVYLYLNLFMTFSMFAFKSKSDIRFNLL